jgi:hypothetical protein
VLVLSQTLRGVATEIAAQNGLGDAALDADEVMEGRGRKLEIVRIRCVSAGRAGVRQKAGE